MPLPGKTLLRRKTVKAERRVKIAFEPREQREQYNASIDTAESRLRKAKVNYAEAHPVLRKYEKPSLNKSLLLKCLIAYSSRFCTKLSQAEVFSAKPRVFLFESLNIH